MFAAWRCPLFVLGFAASGAAASFAQTPAAGFEAANKLYFEGKFADAASDYQKLAASGQVSPALYFNLGNAFFKSGQIGRAIAAYRTAEQLTPRDPDIRANLQFARNQVQGPTLAASRWLQWLGKLTLDEWTLLAAGAIWTALLLFAAMQWRPAWKTALRYYAIGMVLVTGFATGCLAAQLNQTRYTHTAIVIAREIAAHTGPFEDSPNAFTLHDGAELRVLDERNDWLQVTTDPRRIGWVRRDQLLVSPQDHREAGPPSLQLSR